MKIRFISIVLVIFLLALSLISCENPVVRARRPTSQDETKWVSEDGAVKFAVNGLIAEGTIKYYDETVHFVLTTDTGTGMYIYHADALDDGFVELDEHYEKWECSYKSKRKFVATVKETTFFTVGQKITFIRVDE